MIEKFIPPTATDDRLGIIQNLPILFEPAMDTGKNKKARKNKKSSKNKRKEKQKMAMTLELERKQLIWATGYLSAENRILHEIIKVGTAAAKGQLNVNAMTIAGEVLEDNHLPKGR